MKKVTHERRGVAGHRRAEVFRGLVNALRSGSQRTVEASQGGAEQQGAAEQIP